MNSISRIGFLRTVGISEGISFLFLLVIAMPLKYVFGYPIVTKIGGWVHGGLFLLYIVAVLQAIRPMQWRVTGVLVALGASLVPFGTFILDRSLKRREAAVRSQDPTTHQ